MWICHIWPLTASVKADTDQADETRIPVFKDAHFVCVSLLVPRAVSKPVI